MRHKALVRLRSRLPCQFLHFFILAGMAILISRLADNVTPDPTGLPRQLRLISYLRVLFAMLRSADYLQFSLPGGGGIRKATAGLTASPKKLPDPGAT